MMAPDDEAGVAAVIEAAAGRKAPLRIEGLGSKAAFLRATEGDRLSTRNIAGVTLHAPQELIISARAGTTLRTVEATLGAAGQHLIAEPPHYAFLAARDQTIGGIVAANLSGPRRVAWGATRDHVMGMRAVTGRGEIIRSGGRVLKNVTGLDLCKLFAGSYGTLGVMTEVTLKVLPRPEATGTVLISGLRPEEAIGVMSAALGSPYSVSGAAYLPQESAMAVGHERNITVARIEDFADSVSYRVGRLAALLAPFGTVGTLETAASLVLWRAIRDAEPLPIQHGDAVWRISVRPSHGAAILQAGQNAGLFGYLDWGGGLVFLTGPATRAAHGSITEAVGRVGGDWWLLQAPDELRRVVDAVPPEAPALAAIRRRVVTAFDPVGILNPGRLYAA